MRRVSMALPLIAHYVYRIWFSFLMGLRNGFKNRSMTPARMKKVLVGRSRPRAYWRQRTLPAYNTLGYLWCLSTTRVAGSDAYSESLSKTRVAVMSKGRD